MDGLKALLDRKVQEAQAGYDNLMFKGIPVVSVDNQLKIPEDQLR